MSDNAIDTLLETMRRLRAPGGCPWDREQNLETLRPYLLEECYELLDAMTAGLPAQHCEELGDVLLQVVFQAQLREEEGSFSFHDVARALHAKLVRRHPHVFGQVAVDGAEDVVRNWQAIKEREQSEAGAPAPDSILAGIPAALPALQRAQKTQARVARVGFDWPEERGVVAKIEEELRELKHELSCADAPRARAELGDLLFAVVNLCRFRKLEAELVLREATDRFTRRFQALEARLAAGGRAPAECSAAELDEQWRIVKAEEDSAAQRPALSS